MWIVPIGWLYVVLMMSLAEALSSQGTVLGAVFTFLLYGLMPLGIVMYILGTPMRRKASRDAAAAASVAERDRGSQPAGETVAPKGEEP